MSDWYYGKTGAPEGPVDEATLRERIAAGLIQADTLVWKRGMAEWQPLSSHPELSSLLVDRPEISGPPAPPQSTEQFFVPTGLSSQQANVRRTSGLAIASLVCGLGGFATCFFTAIPAVICGHLALREIRRDSQVDGRGMAIAGLVIGYLILVGTVLYALFFVVAISTRMGQLP